ncbi:MAG: hypothetical protein ACPGO5_05085 [Patescibacteria group bacterium]
MTGLVVPRKKKAKARVLYKSPQFIHHENSSKRLAIFLNIPEFALSCEELRPDRRSGKEPMVEVVVMREYVDIDALRRLCLKRGSVLTGAGCVAVVKNIKVVFTTGIGSKFRLKKLLKEVIRS